MYSKYFCALTSSQRARKHRLPHFSLKNVANIRVWLALRAGKTWLRRHRRERKADAVVSSAFFLSLALLAAILSEAISREARFLSTVVHWEVCVYVRGGAGGRETKSFRAVTERRDAALRFAVCFVGVNGVLRRSQVMQRHGKRMPARV